jgi:hypothetical protein
VPSKRELIEPHSGDKRFVRRDSKGEFSNEVDVGKSLAADRRTKAKTVAKDVGVLKVISSVDIPRWFRSCFAN